MPASLRTLGGSAKRLAKVHLIYYTPEMEDAWSSAISLFWRGRRDLGYSGCQFDP